MKTSESGEGTGSSLEKSELKRSCTQEKRVPYSFDWRICVPDSDIKTLVRNVSESRVTFSRVWRVVSEFFDEIEQLKSDSLSVMLLRR